MEVKKMAKMGGKARWANKTPEQKLEHSRLMAEARRRKKLSTPPAVVKADKV